jgi:hypothetical protein
VCVCVCMLCVCVTVYICLCVSVCVFERVFLIIYAVQYSSRLGKGKQTANKTNETWSGKYGISNGNIGTGHRQALEQES